MRKFGLIGNSLKHSFSKLYFEKKFKNEGVKNCLYELYQLNDLSELNSLLDANPELEGLNVTLPYKEKILSYLDETDEVSNQTGAVNCIKIINDKTGRKLKGFNTDVFGFKQSLKPFLEPQHERALILGTGGASKAVSYVLTNLNIPVWKVSRIKKVGLKNIFNYSELSPELLKHFKIIINCTPLGMHPNELTFPELPYEVIEPDFLMYDLVYNPTETLFLKKGKENGAVCINGLSMLYHQADEAWRIWNL